MDRQTVQTAVQTCQLIALIVAIAMVAVNMGRRDAQIGRNIQDIHELRQISHDLLRTSITNQMTDEYQNRELVVLLSRIEKLES